MIQRPEEKGNIPSDMKKKNIGVRAKPTKRLPVYVQMLWQRTQPQQHPASLTMMAGELGMVWTDHNICIERT